MQAKLIPISGVAYFIVSENGNITEILDFSYLNEDLKYKKIMHDQLEFEDEVKTAWKNMQAFLDAEKIIINNKQVKSKVTFVDIIYRGLEEIPHILFFIDFGGPLKKGINTIETYTEKEKLEYDIEVFWKYPENTKIIEVETPMNYEIKKNFIILWSRKGDIIGGYEKIVFQL